MSIMLTVARYPQYPDWIEMVRKNRERFCKLEHGFIVTDQVTNPIGPTWERVELKLAWLPKVGRVIWVDADAMLMNDVSEHELPNCLAMAHDAGGINDGVTVTVARDIAMWKIVRLAGPSYKDHPVMAQGVMQDLNPIHEHLPLDMWNARWWCDYCKIRHFAGAGLESQYLGVKEAYERTKTR